MLRSNFIQLSTLVGIGLSLPLSSLGSGCTKAESHSDEFEKLTFGLLKDWCIDQ